MGLNMDCISSPYSYFEQNQDAVRQVADTNCVWLGNYINWNHNVQAMRDFPSAHQIQQRQDAIDHKTSHRRQQQISLMEIASDMDSRWRKKFMPIEFV